MSEPNTLEAFIGNLPADPLDSESPGMNWRYDRWLGDELNIPTHHVYAVIQYFDEGEAAVFQSLGSVGMLEVQVRLYQNPGPNNLTPGKARMIESYRSLMSAALPGVITQAAWNQPLVSIVKQPNSMFPARDPRTNGLVSHVWFTLQLARP